MKYLFIFALVSLVACGVQEKEVIVEVPVPTERPTETPPPLPPEIPGHMDADRMLQYAQNDAESLNQTDRLNARYLSLANFYNAGDKDLSQEMMGIVKGLNSISTERLLANATAIEPTNSIIRFDLRDIGATPTLWRDFEKHNLIQFVDQSVRGRTLRFLTNTNQPIVHTSSFMVTTMGADTLTKDNGLYYKFIKQPLGLDDFFASLGINLQREVDDQSIQCGGGGNSQIALGKTRLICILDTIANGFLMSTYDTSLAQPDSVLSNPFTVEIANAQGQARSKRVFKHAAQEHIFSLNNGMIAGYRLNGAATGDAEVFAPGDIVIDREAAQAGLDSAIFLGSCQGCHFQTAAIPFNDNVYQQVIGTGGFDPLEKGLAEQYYRNDSFQALLQTANRTNNQLMSELGVNTLAVDPVTRSLIWPLRQELDIDEVASYTFLPVDEFRERLAGTDNSKINFGTLLNGGTVQLSDLAANYQTLIDELRLFRDANEL